MDQPGRPVTAPALDRAAPSRDAGTPAIAHRVVLVLLALGVLTQISYPLLSGLGLRAATIGSVLLLAAAGVLHAGTSLGPRAALVLLLVAGGVGLSAEAVGIRTGFPFGAYHYTGTLGAELLGVPLVVVAAWTMMAYPCLLLGRALTPRLPVLSGAPALAAWDLYLDPQMVSAGHWRFAHPSPALPGLGGIPLTNYAGWLLTAVVLLTLLHRLLPRHSRPEVPGWPPAVLLAWTWAGSAVANLFFFDRPAVAAWGVLGMGASVGPYLWRLTRSAHR